MNGRFPFDVYLIVLLPFAAIATAMLLMPLLMPEHVHHRLAVAVAVAAVIASVALLGILMFWVQRRPR